MFRLPRLALVSTLVSSLILSLVVAGSAMAGGKPLVATLLPGNEVPNPPGGDPSATARGSFAMTVNYGHRTVCYWLSWEGLSTPATAAHIHVGAAGVPGGVVVPLSVVPNSTMTSGSTSDCIEGIDGDLLKAIIQNPTGYYVNVHNDTRPGGAIRGQLTEPED
jgi:hypothetical protein